jgi:hypothetical protein
MDTTKDIKQIQADILSAQNLDKQKLVDKLIELEGMNSMEFFQSIFLKDPFHKENGTFELHQVAGYGVRQLMNLRAGQSKSEFKFCPACKLPLDEYEILDPFMAGLRCKNNHCFHIEIAHGEFKNNALMANTTNNIEIATEWLTNTELRAEIQNQVAEILRKYIELSDSNYTDTEETNSNKFCPICGLTLEEFKQDDVWVQGLKCSNGHQLYSRSGLSFNNATLTPDINKDTFSVLVKSYLEEEQRQHLPNQITQLLTEINEKS